MIKGVVLTSLDIIDLVGGNVFHIMKKSSPGYQSFGEAYFSQINQGVIKAWKRHKIMTLNIVVPVGSIKFVLFDDRDESNAIFQELIISRDNYIRLTVPPNIWVGFQGLANKESMLLNISNIEHDYKEADRLDVDEINYDWSRSI
jgi:dTDP-4-dehydrorhamnose 3,5-epimerase|tara:strand:+ start:780 stop:1214 length:435 start_codon:yes stop_codon:yes gene_type:complete